MSAPKRPTFDVGHDLSAQLVGLDLGGAVVVADPAVWDQVASAFGDLPAASGFLDGVEIDALRALDERMPAASVVVGVGGGASIDAAKYLGWVRDATVVAVPSIASVDAVVTSAVAVRIGTRVRYIGNATPDHVVVNVPLIQGAPPHLNRAGIADILSIHTALTDWRIAADAGHDVFDPDLAQAASDVLQRIFDRADDIARVTERGIRTLIDSFWEETVLCVRWGNPRPEEGSEHFFVYNLERVTERHFVHGEIVCLGVLLMATVQENDPERVQALLERIGVRYQPADLGISRAELDDTLRTLPAFVQENRNVFSVIDARATELLDRASEAADAWLRFAD